MDSKASEQINYLFLFTEWRKAKENGEACVLREVMNRHKINAAIMPDVAHEVKCFINGICQYFNKIWRKHNRTLSKVLKLHSEYFYRPFCLPDRILEKLDSTCLNREGKQKTFDQYSDCMKRRKTSNLRSNFQTSELVYAAQMSLRTAGNFAAAAALKDTTEASSSRVPKTVASKNVAPPSIVPHTHSEALAFIIDQNFSKSQYVNMRKDAILRNANLYPAYNHILLEKKNCYPESITVSETCMEIPLQALLNHTCLRILQASSKEFETFSDEELLNLTMLLKWGFDGSSGHSEYKQRFVENEGCSDSHIFLTSVVPIKVDVKGKTLFQNSTPSSTRYCRPLRIQLVKETTEVSVREKKIVDQQIAELVPFQQEVNGKSVRVVFRMVLTMIDGKICNAITSTASAQRCYLCGATPKDMNNIDQIQHRITNENSYQYGLSSLHAWIRFMEYFLHVAYRLKIQKWQVKGTEIQQLKERKTEIQRRFRSEIGLNIDKPRASGSGTSNDGNTARRFFRNAEKTAEITGLDIDSLRRCGSILQVLASGKKLNIKKFGKFCIDTARLLVNLYPWYYLPASVHKILIHGAQIADQFLVPIGQLSEEAQEAMNKIIRRTRLDHSRKFSRVATNTDVLHRLLELSDPFISSKRSSVHKPVQKLSSDALKMLDLASSSEESSEASDSE